MLTTALIALAHPAIAQPMRGVPLASSGWWVVLGSFAAPEGSSTPASEAAVKVVRARAARCGVEPFNDLSMKFSGLTPGYEVAVMGAYPSKAKAQAALAGVRPCVPGATVRQARYAGE